MSDPFNAGALIDTANGRIDRRIFADKAIYRRELETIFRKCWLFVAHESQIPEPGDFISTYMGEDGVLVVRQRDGAIRVLVNSCPHRGNRVCHAELGRARNFVCNYHGWSFGLDGRLVGLHEKHAFDATPDFQETRHGLVAAPRVASYKGLVFATFAAEGPSLDEYLGDFRWYLDILLDNDEGGTEFLPGAFKNVIRCNWKTPAENFVGDALHAGWTHHSGAMAMLGAGVAPAAGAESYQINVYGHGWQCNLDFPVGNAAALGDKTVLRHLRQREEVIRTRLGAVRAKMLAAVSSGTVFPNFSFLPGESTFRVWHPRGPLETELHSWVLVNRNEPPAVKEAYRKGVMMTFSPSGVFEMDDGENWEFSSRSAGGVATRHQPLYYGLGSHSRADHPELKGNVFAGQMNDANQRAFYETWAAYLDGSP